MSDEQQARHAGRTADPNFNPRTLAEQAAHDQGEKERHGRVIAETPRGDGARVFALALTGLYMACFWPLVLALTVLSGYFAWQAVRPFEADVHPLLLSAAPALAGGIALYVGVKIELFLQRWQLYRGIRHLLRLIVITIAATWLMLQYPGTPPIPRNVTLEWIDQNLSPFRVILIVAIVIVTQILSARNDRGLRDALGDADVDYHIEDEDRGARWRRRGRSFVFFGVVGAVLVPALGFTNDNLLPAFVFGGAVGVVLSRWLYPWWIHPIWRLFPWVNFGDRRRRERKQRRKLETYLKKRNRPPS